MACDCKVVALVLSAIGVLIMGGVMAGFSALLPVLYAEGVAEKGCTGLQKECTSQQYLTLNLMFTSSMFCADAVMVFYGEIMDRYGPRVTSSIGLSLSVIAYILLGLKSAHTWVWFLAFMCLGISGPGIFISCLAFGEIFPGFSALVPAVASSMWDSSSSVFLLFRLGYKNPFSFEVLCWGWAILCLLVGLPLLCLLPSHQELIDIREAAEESSPLASSLRERDEQLIGMGLAPAPAAVLVKEEEGRSADDECDDGSIPGIPAGVNRPERRSTLGGVVLASERFASEGKVAVAMEARSETRTKRAQTLGNPRMGVMGTHEEMKKQYRFVPRIRPRGGSYDKGEWAPSAIIDPTPITDY
jgi:MFS family permease